MQLVHGVEVFKSQAFVVVPTCRPRLSSIARYTADLWQACAAILVAVVGDEFAVLSGAQRDRLVGWTLAQ